MSQNKTVFPGIGGEEDLSPRYQQTMGVGNYSRSNPRPGATVYPGMENFSQNVQSEQPVARPQVAANGKPIVGFLYSVSRTGLGEYWPLHVGPNVIGSSPECDIVLKEATVSQRHAILHINKMKKPEKTEATISDCQSTNGTMVNGNSVSVARPPECVNGDVITVGENYELLFILIDVKACGLSLAEHFIAIEDDVEADVEYKTNATHHGVEEQNFPPQFVNPDAQFNNQSRSANSTVGLDPSTNNRFESGGTVGLE